MAAERVIRASEDSELRSVGTHAARRRTSGAHPNGGLKVRLERPLERRSGDADSDKEAVERCAVAIREGVADIEANLGLSLVVEVVVSADVDTVEDVGFGVLSKESEWTRIGLGVAYADGDRVDIKANLSVGRKGRQREADS